MKNFLKISIIIIPLLILTSCKKKTTEPKTQNNLNQQTAQGIAPAVAHGVGSMTIFMFNPEGSMPMFLKKFGIEQSPCVTKSGDTTDADHDGYFKDATLTFNCNYQTPNGSWSATGTAQVMDKDDNDPTAGFYIKITDLTFQMTTQGQSFSWTMNATYDINRTTTGWSGHIDYSFTFNNLTTLSYSLDFSYQPDDPNNPWVAGTLNFNGNISVKHNNVNYSFQIIAENVHYDKNSGCEYPDSGTVKITDGTNYLTITFNCSTYSATYNGTPVSY